MINKGAVSSVECCAVLKKRLVYTDSLLVALVGAGSIADECLMYQPPLTLDQPEVLKWYPISRSTLWAMVKSGVFVRETSKSRGVKRKPLIIESESILSSLGITGVSIR